MNDIIKKVPLWSITTWDKKFNGVEKEWQPKTKKYKYLLSDELDQLKIEGGNVRLLYTGKDVGYTTEELAGDRICEGEIVSIPWGGIPTVKYHSGKFVTGDNRIMTSNNPNEVSNKYLYYFMKGHIKEIASYYRGASLKHPSMRDVLKMVVSYPSIDRQDSIIKQLDLIEEIIDIRQKELLLFDTLIKARFVEMFGDPFTNPMGWQIGVLGDYMTVLTDFSSNGSYKTLDSNVVMKDEPDYAWMVRTTDLETGDESSHKYIDEWTWNFLEKSKVYGDEIIMCKIGSAGRIYLMPNTGKPASLGRNAFMFRFNNLIDRVYLYYLLTTDYGTKEIMQYVRGAVTKTITKDDVRRVRIIVPPIEKQKEFVSFIEQINKSKAAVQKSLDETQLLFDSLMQQYFG